MLGLSNVEEGGREGGRTAVVKAAGGAGRGESVGTLLRVPLPRPSLSVCLSPSRSGRPLHWQLPKTAKS